MISEVREVMREVTAHDAMTHAAVTTSHSRRTYAEYSNSA